MARRETLTRPPIVRSPRTLELPAGTGVVNAPRLLELRPQVVSTIEPDRQLDADVAEALGHGIRFVTANYTMDSHPAVRWSAPHVYAGMVEPCPRFTSSVDAVLELAHNTAGVDPLAVFLAASHEMEREMTPVPAKKRQFVRAVLPRILLSHLIDAVAALSEYAPGQPDQVG